MGLVTRPHNYVANTLIEAAKANENENTLYTLVNGNIEAANLAPGTIPTVVTPYLFKNSKVVPEESTTSTSPVNLSTFGPQVAVTLTSSGLILLMVQCDIGGVGTGSGQVWLNDGSTNYPLMSSGVGGWAKKRINPAQSPDSIGSMTGVGHATAADDAPFGAIIPMIKPAGTHVLTLKYASSAGSTTAAFRNREIWAQAYPNDV